MCKVGVQLSEYKGNQQGGGFTATVSGDVTFSSTPQMAYGSVSSSTSANQAVSSGLVDGTPQTPSGSRLRSSSDDESTYLFDSPIFLGWNDGTDLLDIELLFLA